MFTDREQVCQQLARVVVVAQRVDDGHCGVLRHLLKSFVGEGAPHDRGGHGRHDARGVFNGFFVPDLGFAGVDDEWLATQCGDTRGEGHTCAG